MYRDKKTCKSNCMGLCAHRHVLATSSRILFHCSVFIFNQIDNPIDLILRVDFAVFKTPHYLRLIQLHCLINFTKKRLKYFTASRPTSKSQNLMAVDPIVKYKDNQVKKKLFSLDLKVVTVHYNHTCFHLRTR